MTSNDTVNGVLVDDQPAKLLAYEVILQELGENLIKTASAREAFECLLKNCRRSRRRVYARVGRIPIGGDDAISQDPSARTIESTGTQGGGSNCGVEWARAVWSCSGSRPVARLSSRRIPRATALESSARASSAIWMVARRLTGTQTDCASPCRFPSVKRRNSRKAFLVDARGKQRRSATKSRGGKSASAGRGRGAHRYDDERHAESLAFMW
jgi:hypothetical protein